MSSPFAMPPSSSQNAPSTGASRTLALLCIEVLSSELVFSEPTVNRDAVHQSWHQQVVERLAQLGENLGASVERQYQNIAFVSFSQEVTPVDALESAIKLVLNLQKQPLPIAQQHPSPFGRKQLFRTICRQWAGHTHLCGGYHFLKTHSHLHHDR